MVYIFTMVKMYALFSYTVSDCVKTIVSQQ